MYKRGNGTNAFKEEKEWGKVKERKRNVGSGQKQKGRGDRWNAFAILGEACKPFWYAKSPEHTASQAKRKVYGVEIVLYILFTFHFTLLLLTLGASFYIPPSRLFREIVFSIYREFRWLAIYISNFNYPL